MAGFLCLCIGIMKSQIADLFLLDFATVGTLDHFRSWVLRTSFLVRVAVTCSSVSRTTMGTLDHFMSWVLRTSFLVRVAVTCCSVSRATVGTLVRADRSWVLRTSFLVLVAATC